MREAGDRASRKALELAPQLAESHIARGHALKIFGRIDDAEREYQKAIAIHPNSFDAHELYGRLCFRRGRMEDAATLFRRGAEIRLEDCECPLLLALTLRALGGTAEAREAYVEAIRRAERQLALDPGDARLLSLGAPALIFLGDRERALAWADRAVAAAPDDPGVTYNVACAYASMGDPERAFECLERTFGRGMGRREWVEHDSDLDPLRDDARFQALLARLP